MVDFEKEALKDLRNKRLIVVLIILLFVTAIVSVSTIGYSRVVSFIFGGDVIVDDL